MSIPGGINSFIATLSENGGLASSNNFEVRIKLPDTERGKAFKDATLKLFGSDNVRDEYFTFMCNEAQLPNVNAATGQINGIYLGIGANDYPHTRIFTELDISFLLDANLTALKFFNMYHQYIFGDLDTSNDEAPDEFLKGNKFRKPNRVNRLEFANDYVSDIYITKTEQGPRSSTERKPITYILERAYPYSIDAVPLQFGPTQPISVNVNFKYDRYYTIDRDISFIKGDASVLPGIKSNNDSGTLLNSDFADNIPPTV